MHIIDEFEQAISKLTTLKVLAPDTDSKYTVKDYYALLYLEYFNAGLIQKFENTPDSECIQNIVLNLSIDSHYVQDSNDSTIFKYTELNKQIFYNFKQLSPDGSQILYKLCNTIINGVLYEDDEFLNKFYWTLHTIPVLNELIHGCYGILKDTRDQICDELNETIPEIISSNSIFKIVTGAYNANISVFYKSATSNPAFQSIIKRCYISMFGRMDTYIKPKKRMCRAEAPQTPKMPSKSKINSASTSSGASASAANASNTSNASNALNPILIDTEFNNYRRKYKKDDIMHVAINYGIPNCHKMTIAELEDAIYAHLGPNTTIKFKIYGSPNTTMDGYKYAVMDTIINVQPIPKTLKSLVWDTYIGKEHGIGACYCCGSEIDSKHFECGHIVSKFNGGESNMTNLRPVCSICNKSIGAKNMDVFKATYFKK